jgi:hypothetical protein
MSPQPDRTINSASLLVVANVAVDVDTNRLSYELLEAPAGAVIGSADGVIRWYPSAEYVPSETVFTTVVTDDGTPPLCATNTFKVTVLDAAHSGPVAIIGGPILYPANRHQYFILEATEWDAAEAIAQKMGDTRNGQ